MEPKNCCNQKPWCEMVVSRKPKDSYWFVLCGVCNKIKYSYESKNRVIKRWNDAVQRT